MPLVRCRGERRDYDRRKIEQTPSTVDEVHRLVLDYRQGFFSIGGREDPEAQPFDDHRQHGQDLRIIVHEERDSRAAHDDTSPPVWTATAAAGTAWLTGINAAREGKRTHLHSTRGAEKRS